jgi:hypothetical protein
MGHNLDAAAKYVNLWRPTVIKWLGNPNWLLELSKQINYEPKPKFVQRFWWSNDKSNSNDFGYYYTMTGLENAYGRWLQCIGENSLDSLKGLDNFYIESFNEVGISKSYCEFEAYRAKRLWESLGLRSCVLNSGVGWTLPFDQMRARTTVAFHTRQAIKHERAVFKDANDAGMLDAMRKYGAVFGIHSYGAGVVPKNLGIDFWHGPDRQAISQEDRHLKHDLEWYAAHDREIYAPDMLNTWLAFRVARYHDQVAKLGYADLKFIITEAGIDGVLDPHSYKIYSGGRYAGGWRDWAPIWQEMNWLENCTAAYRYAVELEYAERQYRAYSDFLLGATIFGGTGNWQHFNPFPEVIDELLPILDKLDEGEDQPMPDEPTEPVVVVPPEEPEEKPTQTVDINTLVIGKEEAEFLTQLYNQWANDCGLVSAVKPKVAMITHEPETIGDMYGMVGRAPDNGTFTLSELEDILDLSRIPSTVYHNSALGQIFEILHERRPIIALVRYEVMRQHGYATPIAGNFGHFVVVIGITLSDVYFYDPLQKTETISSMSIEGFLAAWDYYSRGFVAPDQQPSTLERDAEFNAKVIAQPRLNVRKSPTLDYSSLYKPYRYKYPGTIVPVHETHVDGSGNVWYRISDQSWICAKLGNNEYAKRIE